MTVDNDDISNAEPEVFLTHKLLLRFMHYTPNLNKSFRMKNYFIIANYFEVGTSEGYGVLFSLLDFSMNCMVISASIRCGVEQWQLVGLITRRSQVQVLSPLLNVNQRPPGSVKTDSPAVFDLRINGAMI